ncbi:hypothetical protein BT96DRAFT_573530 [Gymnopus androsaceus JB14]|uniref:Uncharacterized protein n=1 Tax=Gymnopus androsaceus JB14 TaxID=1447944 RepID=A0A6A4HVN6_9AGAR|nr:hypothetical protein BT96DRAFT_573530 [Gymnopus androsaceus JB14]
MMEVRDEKHSRVQALNKTAFQMPDFGQNEHQLDDNHYSSPNSSLGSPIVRFGTKRKRDVSPSSTVSDSARGGHLPREISDSPPPFLSSFSACSTNASPGNISLTSEHDPRIEAIISGNGAHAADNSACSISVSSNVRASQPSGVVHSNPQIDVVGGRSSGSDIHNAKRRRQPLEPASSPSCGSGFASRAGLLDGVHVPKVPAQSVIAFLNKKTERLEKESRALDAALASAKEVHLIINDKNEKIAKLKEENEAKKQMLAEFNRLIESSCIE